MKKNGMRFLIQRQSQRPQLAPSDSARAGTRDVCLSRQADLILPLQRSIGNQAVQRLVLAEPDGLDVGISNSGAVGLPGGFSRVPTHSRSPANVQAKLTVSPPGDVYEQEADRVSQQVMHMPVQHSMSSAAHAIVQRSPDNKPAGMVPRASYKLGEEMFSTGVPEDLLMWTTAVLPTHLDDWRGIMMLAANPDEAHFVWKRLTPQAQTGVAIYMAIFYGDAFATQFVALHNTTKAPESSFQKVGSETTPGQLTARGFHFAGMSRINIANVEIWFHPSGSRLHRVTAWVTGTEEKTPIESLDLEKLLQLPTPRKTK